AATSFSMAAASATSPSTASAAPPCASISLATASASAALLRVLTTTAAPPAASSSAMARPILRPAPVTIATRPSSSLLPFMRALPAEDVKIDGAVEHRARQLERGIDAAGIPAAVLGVEDEFLLDVAPRQRLVSAAAQMRLAFLDRAAVAQGRADVTGEIVG